MAFDPFNSVGGFSVGIPEIQVIDSNGNVVTNVLALDGNVAANVVYAGSYKYANGQPFTPNSAGSNTQLQFNNNGVFGGVPNVTWNGTHLSLGNVSAVKIFGGENGYFLQTDGAGNLTFAAGGNGGGGNGSPGGANTQVQFNDAGSFGGDSGFTYDKDTNTLSASNINGGNINANFYTGDGSGLSNISVTTANYVTQSNQPNITSVGTLTSLTVSGNTNLGDVANVRITGGINGYILSTDGTGNLSWIADSGGGGAPGGGNSQIQFNNAGSFGGSNAFIFNNFSNTVTLLGNMTVRSFTANNTSIYGSLDATGNITGNFILGDGGYLSNVNTNTANYVIEPIQSNITTLGTLTSLTVSGNIITAATLSGAAIQTTGNANTGQLRVTGNANVSGTLTVSGNINAANTSNVSLGNISNIHISGGLNGYVMSTDGTGNLSWAPPGGSNGGSPGGSNRQVQYNDNGEFGGSAYFTFNDDTNTVQVAGQFIANAMQLGSGSYKFCSSQVYFVSTASASKQVLYSIPVSECSGVEFEIIGTDSIAQKRQSLKISSLYYAGAVQFVEYATIYINGGVGDFQVEYNPGNIIVEPSIDLAVTPDSSNQTVYKMWVTVLAP